MALEPTHEQSTHIQELAPGKLALVQFMAIKDQDAFAHYRSASRKAVREAGGKRTHCVVVDQVLTGGEMPYQAIMVDVFPSPQTALTTHGAARADGQAALAEGYVLAVRPRTGLPSIAKALRFFAPILRLLIATTSEKATPRFTERANPETGPVPETIAMMRAHDQTTPFFMMNLNKYYPQAVYENGEDVSGGQAYNRYAMRITPYLISVGGFPDIIGQVVGVLVGSKHSAMHDSWNDFVMVYYPSRRRFLQMMTNSPTKGMHHRDAGLQRAVLMPSSSIR